MQPFKTTFHLLKNTQKIKASSMKNSYTLAVKIICTAFFLLSMAQTAMTQDNAAKTTPSDTGNWHDEDIYIRQLREDGIPEGVIKTMVANRRKLILQGRKIVPRKESIKVFGKSDIKTMATCADMGGENGWGSWTARSGTYASCSPSFGGSTAPSAPRYNLTSGPGTDPCGAPGPPIPVVAPGFGNVSIQIGQPQVNGQGGGCSPQGCIEELTYPLVIGPNDTNFTFAYAIVMENPASHNNCEQPYVSLCIYDSNGNSIGSCGCFTYVSGPSLPGFYTSSCNINSVTYYRPWTMVGINLKPWMNQPLTVVVQNADCSLSGHYAHSYWDFSCGTLASTTQFCIGEDSVLLCAPNDPGMTYSWSTGQTTSCIIVNPQLTDTVTLQVIPSSGCGFYLVYALAPTIINTAISYTVNCNKVTFADNTTITGGTITSWNWQFPGGSPSSSTSQNPPVITYPTAGTYTASLTVVSQAGCTDTTVYVPITIGPPPVVTANNATLCGNQIATICANGGVSYSWSPGGTTTNCITVTTASAPTYTVVATDANGCTGVATASVLPSPPPVITASSGTVCQGLSSGACATLTASGGVTYQWSPSTYLSAITGNAVLSCATTAITYTVTGIDMNGCSNTTTASVNITPNPSVSVLSPSTICFGQSSAQLSAVGNVTSYSWVPNNGLSCYNCPNPIATPSSTSTYTVYVTDANGCINAASVPIVVGAVPQLTAIASKTVCTGQSVVLNANYSNVPPSQMPVKFNWTPPNSPPLSSDTVQNPTVTPNTSTYFCVKITDKYGCWDTACTMVYVESVPSVSWTEWTPYITCEGYVIPFFADVSDNGTSVWWSFGDNSTYADYQPTPNTNWTSAPPPHAYNFNSTYSVSVIAINNICRDTIDTTFTISDMGQYLNVGPANVFTPNNDLYNECFRPALTIHNIPNTVNPDSLKKTLEQCVELEIWDRWGIKMFESDATTKCWDGKTKGGKDAKQGTYYYIARFKDFTLKGYVELIR